MNRIKLTEYIEKGIKKNATEIKKINMGKNFFLPYLSANRPKNITINIRKINPTPIAINNSSIPNGNVGDVSNGKRSAITVPIPA